jgi:deoxyribonuclease-4
MKIGAHVSSAGTLDTSIERAKNIGAEAIQIFVSPPQNWTFKTREESEFEIFRRKAADAKIEPIFLHGVYLINLATPKEVNLQKAIDSLKLYLESCAKLGGSGVIFHVGSHLGKGIDSVLPQVVEALKRILDNAPENVFLVLENNAGQGRNIGAQFDELAKIIEPVNDSRLKICLDTAHTLASGYDITTPESVAFTATEFINILGESALVAVHANDSKVNLGEKRDRHENIGDGFIGNDGFHALLSHSLFQDVPFFLEVPGYDGKGPDKRNVDTLKSLREKAQLSI